MLVLSLASAAFAPPASTVSVDTRKPTRTVDERFVSLTSDIQNFVGFGPQFDWNDPSLSKLVGTLAPLIVRCGGTWEDGMLWEHGPRTGLPNRWTPPDAGRVALNLTAAAWTPFAQFITRLPGVDVAVGLNALLRDWGDCKAQPNASCAAAIPWQPDNAKAFIAHNRQAGYRIWGYELGNEPGTWNWTWGTPIVLPKQHAPDYAALRALLNEVFAGDGVPKVVGPDTTWGPLGDMQPDGSRSKTPWDYFGGIMQQQPSLDVAAFHYYTIQPSLVRTWHDFVTVARSGSMCSGVAAYIKDVDQSALRDVPIWLGEGGSSYRYGGVVDVWLKAFGGALSYMEDLGCAASNGATVFARQQLSNFVGPTSGTGGNAPKYQPLPSWWVAMLWKRLMGVSILSATVDALSASAEHVHAFAAELKGAGGDERNASRVVAFALVNWADAGTAPASLRVALPAGRKCTRGASFVLSSTNSTSTDAAVLALGIQLNGVPLKLAPGGALPASLEPHWTACDADGAVALTLEPLSAAFVVVE